MIAVLHLVALLALFAADYWSTARGISLGAYEANPLIRDGARRPIYWRSVLIRAVTTPPLMWTVFRWPELDLLGLFVPSWTVLTLYAAVLAFVVARNLRIIRKLEQRRDRRLGSAGG